MTENEMLLMAGADVRLADIARRAGVPLSEVHRTVHGFGLGYAGKFRRPSSERTCRICGNVYVSKARQDAPCDTCAKAHFDAQANATLAVRKAIEQGILIPPNTYAKCADCWRPATEYDHRDYSKPLDVVPVCRGCNIKRGPAKP